MMRATIVTTFNGNVHTFNQPQTVEALSWSEED